MAITDVIKRLIWQFSSTGADQVANDMGKVNAEQTKLAVNTENTTKASLDLEKSFDNLERRFDSTIRAQQDYAKVQAQVNAAVAQHPELQERANNVLELAADKFDKAGSSAGGFSKLLDKGRESLAGFAAEGGPLGALLGSFGPWGVAAAAGIGLVTAAFEAMRKGAEAFGNTSSAMKSFSDNTGLTITQIRGLNEAGAQVGMSADAVGSAMQKFTSNLQAAHQGTGELYDGLKQIDKGLADQIQASHGDAEAFDIVAKAINAATDAATKMNIARAAFGKGGASMVGVADITGDANGMNAYADSVVKASGITSEMITKSAELAVELKSLTESNEALKQSFYAQDLMKSEIETAQKAHDVLLEVKQVRDDLAQGKVPMLLDIGGAGNVVPVIVDTKNATDALTASTNDNTQARNANAAATEASKGGLMDEVAALHANTQAKTDNTNAAIAQANQSAANIAALGSAATAEEIANARIAALTASFDKGAISADIYSRAVAGIRDAYAAAIPVTQGMIAAQNTLGDLMRQNIGGSITLPDITKQAAGSARDLADNFKDAGVQGKVLYDSTKNVADQTKTASGNIDDMGTNTGRWKQQIFAANDALGTSIQLVNTLGLQLSRLPDVSGQFNLGVPMPDASGQFNLSGGTLASALAGGANYDSSGYGVYTGRTGSNFAQPGFSPSGGAGGGGDFAGLNDLYSTFYRGGGTGPRTGPSGDPNAVRANAGIYSTYDPITGQKIAPAKPITDLTKSIDDLKKSTDNLNATNQDLLSPFYTQDPRTSHIGFRSQGMAAGGYVDVPGGASANDNMMAMIPVASGERIYVDPQSGRRGTAAGGGMVINISSPITINGNANADQFGRTVYQANQQLAKSVRAATQ